MRLLLLPVLSIFIVLTGCDKFEGDQTIPAYLQVDSLGFSTDNTIQGTANQNFMDVWLYVDDNLIGGFEMPVQIPVLAAGQHKVEIRPGIILNGISDTRAPYPLVKPIVIQDYDFIIDSVQGFNGTTSYLDNVEFVWMEDFENPNLQIIKAHNSDTGMVRTNPANAPGAYLDTFSEYSGISHLDTDRHYLMLVSDDGTGQGFVFKRGDFIFLEMHYKNNLPLVIGAFIQKQDNTIHQRSFLILNPTDHWKKIYVNFTPMVNETVDAVNYKIYIEADKNMITGNGIVMLDNIKLVTRPNL
ncbi:MAG: hypothetical protein K0B08_12030 [Bacteroidales bacterium]|nr:hypothetical protein [Bacteroidales bacterium]